VSRGEPFKLSAGGTSPYLFDLKPVMLHAEGAALLGKLCLEAIRPWRPTHVGGMELGAVPLAVAVVQASHTAPPALRGFVVRKEPKGHGIRDAIVGNLPPTGAPVAVVEDVSTTGRSVLEKTLPRLRDAGAEVRGVLTVVDREQGAAENYAKANVPFRWLLRLGDFPELAGLR
jgi:orotate phosphoribosyltransferase